MVVCRELGIGIVPFSHLGKGFFSSGPKVVENFASNDFRKVCTFNTIINFSIKMEKILSIINALDVA